MTSSPDSAGGRAAEAHARWAAAACAVAGAAVFHFFGNANRGYIDSASLFYWWGFQWVNPRSETQHGWFVLAAAIGVLVWNLRRLKDDRPAGRVPLWPAVAAMLAGLALHLVGFVAQQARVSIVALLVFAWGVLRLGGGPRWGRSAMFPLGFLVFAVPVNALDTAGFWLRVWVVDASARLAHAAGIEVLRSGTQLLAPDGRYNYDVAAACSGVRSLTALTALALLAGYVSFRSPWRRAATLLVCFPLVYVGNVARIAAIVLAAHLGGQAWGERVHGLMGVGVFAIVLGGVLATVAAIQRWWPERVDAIPIAVARGGSASGRKFAGVALFVVVLAAVEMAGLHALKQRPPGGDAGVLLAEGGRAPVDLPAFLGTAWMGRREEVTAVEREILPPDTGFSRRSYTALGDPRQQVYVSIVLSGRDRTSIHRPELCLVGQGWTIVDATPRQFRFPGHPDADFPATLLEVRRDLRTPRGPLAVRHYVAYWFVGADAVVATHWQRLARDAWNRVTKARADRWAYVLLQTDATDGEAAAMARMQAVLDGTLTVFQRPIATK
jgi:EpsI family protein